MSDTKGAWDEVGRQLSGLGLRLKLHLAQAGVEAGAADDVKDALRNLGSAIESGFTGLGNAAQDPAVRDDVSRVAKSFADALAASLSEIGSDIAEAVKARRSESGADDTEA